MCVHIMSNVAGNSPTGPVSSMSDHSSSFCIGLRMDGQAYKVDSGSLKEYRALPGQSSLVWIDCCLKDVEHEIADLASAMGFSELPVEQLISQHYSSYEDCDSELGIMLPAVRVDGFSITIHKLIVLIKGNFILTAHNEDIVRLGRFSRYAPTIMRKMSALPTNDKITLLLERIIDENNERNAEYLREIDTNSERIIKSLTSGMVDKGLVVYDIYNAKRVLITYLDVFWATKDVLESLRHGDADLISDDERLLDRISVLSTKVDQHLSLAEQTSNALSSGYSVLQDVQGNLLQETNNKISLVGAYMTVIGTLILVPNTLATVISTINGQAGREWWYTPFIIIATIASTALAFIWVIRVQRKKDD